MIDQVEGQSYITVKQHFDFMVMTQPNKALRLVSLNCLHCRNEPLSGIRTTFTTAFLTLHFLWALHCQEIMAGSEWRERLRLLWHNLTVSQMCNLYY